MQTEENKYFISEESKKLIEKDLSSFRNNIYFGTPFGILVSFLLAYRVALDFEENFNFVFLTVFIGVSIIPLIITVLLPLKALKRYNSCIKSIRILNDEIFIATFDKEGLKLMKGNYKIERSDFLRKKEDYKSLIIYDTVNNKSYIIVSSFFDEYSTIEEILLEIPDGADL